MQYKDLNELISNSRSSREFFISMPVSMQMALHQHNNYIHSAQELHQRASEIKSYIRSVETSKYYEKQERKLKRN